MTRRSLAANAVMCVMTEAGRVMTGVVPGASAAGVVMTGVVSVRTRAVFVMTEGIGVMTRAASVMTPTAFVMTATEVVMTEFDSVMTAVIVVMTSGAAAGRARGVSSISRSEPAFYRTQAIFDRGRCGRGNVCGAVGR